MGAIGCSCLLCVSAKVSPRFFFVNVCSHPRDFFFFFFSTFRTQGALVDNVALRGNLRALDLSSLAAVGDALLADLGASAPNLTSLSLSSCAGVSASGPSVLGMLCDPSLPFVIKFNAFHFLF